jgi:hypothetical protein
MGKPKAKKVPREREKQMQVSEAHFETIHQLAEKLHVKLYALLENIIARGLADFERTKEANRGIGL